MRVLNRLGVIEVKKGHNTAFILGFNEGYKKAKLSYANSYSATYKIAKMAATETKYSTQNAIYHSKVLRPAVIALLAFVFGLNVGKVFLPVNIAQAVQAAAPVDTVSESNNDVIDQKLADKRITPEIATYKARNVETVSNSAHNNGSTASSIPMSGLYIQSVGIATPVYASSLQNGTPTVPSSGASQYGSLIMGHVFGVFSNLANTAPGQVVYLNGEKYVIAAVERNLPVSSDRKLVGNYNMNQLVYRGQNLTIMTCAGSYSAAINTYSHRTLVFANKV